MLNEWKKSGGGAAAPAGGAKEEKKDDGGDGFKELSVEELGKLGMAEQLQY